MEEITTQLLARHLAGDTTEEESERVREWLETHPELRSRLEGIDPGAAGAASGRAADLFLASVFGGEGERGRTPRRADRTPSRRAMPRRAVARSARTTLGLLLLFAFIVVALIGRDLLLPNGESTSYATGPGEYAQFTLPDGSEVELNVASTIEVPADFGSGRRVVRLQGEAFFDVEFDPGTPFVVETARVEVEVLGTRFDVSAYEGDPVASVAVTEGSVLVRSGEAEASLSPGRRARLTAAVLQVDSLDVTHLQAWRDGQLVFRDASLSDVARRMGRWYGVSTRLEDAALDSLHLDATFDGESIEEAARATAAALNIQVDIEDAHVVFRAP